jgi:hypothetical protein
VSAEYTPMIKVRERTVWFTDHPGATVEDFDRQRRLFTSVHGGQQRRQHKAYLDWLKDDDEIPPLAAGAVMMTITAL